MEREKTMSEFLGVPVSGEITRYTERQVEQHDPRILLDMLDELLALPHVEAVRWEQYTPYFNDGDACVFNVCEATVRLDVSDEEFLYDFDLRTPGKGSSWQERYENSVYEYEGVDTTEIYSKLYALNCEMGHHDQILLEKFGDPAQVTYDGKEFNVEFYDHD